MSDWNETCSQAPSNKEFTPEPGWLNRQAKNAERDMAELPDSWKRAAGIDPDTNPHPLRAELATVTAERDKLRAALTMVSNIAARQLAEPVTTHDTAELVNICTAAESALSVSTEPKPEEAKCAECAGRGGYGTTSFEGTCGYCNGTGRAQ